jgi:hypothetical protein
MSEELTNDEFCARFVARMMKALPIFAGTEDELREYAEETAPTYWDEPGQRKYGPEACAEADISYWEGE